MRSLLRGPEWRWLATLAVIALVLRLGWAVLMMDRTPQFDEVEYMNLAGRLAVGEGYIDETGRPVAFWPVGYPALLSVVFRLAGSTLWAGVGLQIALSVATCLLLSIVGSRVLGPGPGRLAGLLLAMYPTHVMYSTLQLTEPLFMLLLLGVASCLFVAQEPRLGGLLAAGLLFGLAVLTRPLILPLALLFPFALHRKDPKLGKALLPTAVVLTMTLITISPWLWRNHGLSGRSTTVTTSGGYNFWVGNNPDARGGYISGDDIKEPLRDGEGFDWHRGYRLGWEWVREHPSMALLRMPLKVSHLVALETDGVLWNLKGFDRAPPTWVILVLLLIANVAYVAVLSTSLPGILGSGESVPIRRFTIGLCVYMMLIVMVFFGDPRFHLPLIPFLLLGSASVLAEPGRWSQRGSDEGNPELRRRMKLCAGVMLVLALLMVVNLGVKYGEGAW